MRTLASVVTGRRGKWVVLALWLVAVIAVFPFGSKLSNETTDSTESFLPASAESTEVVKRLEHDFPQGETDTGIVVYKNPNGLTPANKQKILADAKGGKFSSPYGHGAGWFDVGVPVLDKTIFDWKKRTSGEVAKRLGENRVYIPGHANLFPNFMMLGANTFRVTHPRGPNEMEIWSWSMAPVAAPPEVKDAIRVDLLSTFSGAGMLEQDDAVNWEEEQAVLRGFMARSEHLKYRQLMNKARYDHNGYPGKTVPRLYSEQAARDMYLHYSDLMSGAPWPELVKLKAERVEQERQACGKNNFLNPAEA